MTFDPNGWQKRLKREFIMNSLHVPDDFTQGTTKVERQKIMDRKQNETHVQLPRHMFAPEDSDTIDIPKIMQLAIGDTNIPLIRFTPQQGQLAFFTHYSLANDALLATDVDFFPLVNGKRILPYHGDSLLNFRLYASISPDLSVLRQGIVIVSPGDIYEWRVTNYAAVQVTVGVRAVGYVTAHQLIEAKRFG